jgi:hypothetical protein
MRVPVNERVKEAPAQALRAMFAGIGQLLLVTDRLRNRAPEGTPTADTPDAADAADATDTPDAAEAAPAEAGAETAAQVPTQTAPVAEEAEAPAPSAEAVVPTPETVEATEAPAEAAGELPLPNYDELTVPSLRARMRNLSVDQLNSLISYEQSHANREEVIGMFQRRIAKLAEG